MTEAEKLLARMVEAWNNYERNPWGGTSQIDKVIGEAKELLGRRG